MVSSWGLENLFAYLSAGICLAIPATLRPARASALALTGVRFPESCQEEVRDQKQLLKDAAAFLLSCQIPGLVREGPRVGVLEEGAVIGLGTSSISDSGGLWDLQRSDFLRPAELQGRWGRVLKPVVQSGEALGDPERPRRNQAWALLCCALHVNWQPGVWTSKLLCDRGLAGQRVIWE